MQRYRAISTFKYCLWKCKMVQLLWKRVCQFLVELNIHLSYDSSILWLGIYSRKMEVYVHTKICIQMFIEALVIIANWKQPKYPSMDELLYK